MTSHKPLNRLFAAAAGVALVASVAFAQAPAPPTPRQVDNPATWLFYIIIAVLLGATVVVSVFPSKRGHMD